MSPEHFSLALSAPILIENNSITQNVKNVCLESWQSIFFSHVQCSWKRYCLEVSFYIKPSIHQSVAENARPFFFLYQPPYTVMLYSIDWSTKTHQGENGIRNAGYPFHCLLHSSSFVVIIPHTCHATQVQYNTTHIGVYSSCRLYHGKIKLSTWWKVPLSHLSRTKILRCCVFASPSCYSIFMYDACFCFQLTSSGAPFWSGPKRCPHPLEFSTSNVRMNLLCPLILLCSWAACPVLEKRIRCFVS